MLGFRVWDSLNKCFYVNPSEDGLYLNSEGILIAITATFDRIHEGKASDRFIPMLSTGVHDNNYLGKEIFQGDVLYVERWDELHENETATHYLLVDDIPYFLMNFGNPINFTIIGNICENPELLKEI